MSGKEHAYETTVRWTGNRGVGTADYKAYDRTHEIAAAGKPVIPGSSDPSFRGNADRYNPEDLLVASISTCHLLWYLHLCSEAGVVVTDYVDTASGTMVEVVETGGHFTEAVLRPVVTISAGDLEVAIALHDKAHHLCFVANSLNFPVRCEPTVLQSSA